MEEYSIEDFKPPDEDMVERVLTNSKMISLMSEDADGETRAILESASRSLKILLAMAVSGSYLHRKESYFNKELSSLAESLYDRLLMADSTQITDEDTRVLANFRAWLEADADEDEIFD